MLHCANYLCTKISLLASVSVGLEYTLEAGIILSTKATGNSVQCVTSHLKRDCFASLAQNYVSEIRNIKNTSVTGKRQELLRTVSKYGNALSLATVHNPTFQTYRWQFGCMSA